MSVARKRAVERASSSGRTGTPATARRSEPQTKAARHARIVELLTRASVRSQSELAELLADDGLSVTQATLSRDLDEIGAVRLRGAAGGFVYVVPRDGDDAVSRPASDRFDAASAAHARLIRMATDLLISVRSSGNLVVAKTPPGGAHLLAGAIDHSDLSAIIGTVAGDDTVLCICRDLDGGADVAQQLLKLADRRVT